VIVPGLISQYRFAERIESILFAIVARDSFHLLTPFPWGCRVDFSLSANMTPETPDSARFFENFQIFFEAGRFSGGNRKAQQTENGQPGIMAARNAQYLHRIVHSKSPADPVREQGFF